MAEPKGLQTGQVFLSYSRTDRIAAVALRAALQQAGLAVFHDEDAIRVGDLWMTRLQDALKACSAFVVLVGRDGVRRWVGAEVQVALNRHLAPHDEAERLPIFPVLLEGGSPETLPPFLALFQAATWSDAEPLPATLLEAIQKRTSQLHPPEALEGCPFLGLSAFRQKDARLFFGRRQETLEALACLGSQQETNPEHLSSSGGSNYHRWLQIEGNSGAGKSSLVNAGMLPMIERGALWARTGVDHWWILGPMMPGNNPLEKLAEVLEHALIAPDARRDLLGRVKRLEQDERALAFALREVKQEQSAFLLIVDQFEELFTFAEDAPRKQFDALLANALQDAECPLFLINTVRADFLDRFEQLPRLHAIYNRHCKRFSLPTVSENGLREIIEQPARLAGLEVSEVTTAILQDARGEIGALPLVENALFVLWQQREGKRLSGERYRQQNGIAGMLSRQADALLARIDDEVPKGRHVALELLLRLTRINDEGRHTRQRISREEAVMVAGDGNAGRGERVVQLLSGERALDGRGAQHDGALRLITTHAEQDQRYVDLIHETLIRARGRDEKTGKPVGYWPTLYEYIEDNRDRDIHRQQLKFEVEQWQRSRGLSRWWNLAGLRELRLYRRLRTRRASPEGRFLAWSRWSAGAQLGVLLLILAVVGESAWWAKQNSLPFGYTFIKPLWVLGYTPQPEMVEIPKGTFTMGCVVGRDAFDVVKTWILEPTAQPNISAGFLEVKCPDDETPAHEVTIALPFTIGRYEVTFLEYDAYVWYMRRKGKTDVQYPSDQGWGRFDRPVINVSWDDAKSYARWLSERSGKPYRLPTEAEWEYAARAGTTKRYALPAPDGGEDIKDKGLANCAGCGSEWDDKKTAPVGSFAANRWGLHDTAGNVYEWVEDAFAKYTDRSPAPNGAQPAQRLSRVLRGGSWRSSPADCSASSRNSVIVPAYRENNFGFRLCCSSHIE